MAQPQEQSAKLTEAFAGVTRTFRGKVDDLYGLFNRKRQQEPVMKGDVLAEIGIPSRAASPDGRRPVYSLFRFADVQGVLRDGQTYSSALLLEHLGKFLGRIITGLDGAEHRAVRGLLQPAFSASALRSWRTEIMEPLAAKLISRLASKGCGELFGDIFIPFPMHTVYRVIGFPDDDAAIERFAGRALSILCGVQVDPAHAEEARRAAGEAVKEILADATALIRERRRTGSEGFDLIGSLVRAEFEGHALSDADIAQFVIMLLPAAAETTTRTLSNLFTLLLQHPEQLALLQRDRSLVQRAISEAVRYEPVPMYLARQASRDVTIGGVDIPAGSGLTLVIGSANRDETVWEEAERFDIQRKMQASVGFGFGPHACLGMLVARTEMEILVNAMLDRMPNLRLDPQAVPPRISGAHFRGPDAIPAVWDV
jgi:cytochrome P450